MQNCNNKKYMLDAATSAKLGVKWPICSNRDLLEFSYIPLLSDGMTLHHLIKFQVLKQKFRRYEETAL